MIGKHIFTVFTLLCLYFVSTAGDNPKMPGIRMKSDHGMTINDSIIISWGNVVTTLGRDTIISDSAITNYNTLRLHLKGNIYISSGRQWKVSGNELIIDYTK